jgi:hypothetical protein
MEGMELINHHRRRALLLLGRGIPDSFLALPESVKRKLVGAEYVKQEGERWMLTAEGRAVCEQK